ncbi:FadR/GntR family transcriptional regulator [Leucobacter aridicollis]|uniref:FadR/GntR family transcriptional regulator n=1 Tax=Leucobacter aridicollis TaxID=283878 RepID=UPI002102A2C2|nr:FadR/GntR family transcriptional regulator [Leucobacter aridicollis]UTX53956.1 FadR family transcriptional regulator [Leucobacter aridicollis]
MSLDPIRQSSLSDKVVERLRTEIVEGRWRVGERIPPEPELIADLGVARGTLREAIRALQYSGMLDVRRGDGTFVTARSEVPGALARSGGSIGDVLEARAAIEPQLARLAAERANEGDIERIAEALDYRALVTNEPPTRENAAVWAQADAAFHEEVARAAHNPILFEIYAALLPQLRESVESAITRDGFSREDPRGHEEVLAAIRRQDPEAAGASAAANLAATERWDHAERAGAASR